MTGTVSTFGAVAISRACTACSMTVIKARSLAADLLSGCGVEPGNRIDAGIGKSVHGG
ncbi:hypothetical protein GCM10017750_09610 [Streptomyces racemochromogenes]|nr:hypothetical protein Slala01_13160 [Streptomyces lavendulae subsp. lavendulae]GLX24467.1 hypothetical protein Slala02_02870 [Streptomyces lavendulae subsp. lavendulae]